MGFQSYIIPYSKQEHREAIIKKIQQHNNATDEMLENNVVGEKLIGIVDGEITPPYKAGVFKNYTNAILCGNGGGRSSTFEFFTKNPNGMRIIPFERAFEKRFKNVIDVKEF